MTPIRIALIGLSASAKVNWAEQGHLPYLQSARGKSHYEIVALLNSSVEAAKAARTHFNLPATVKTYGSPDELAKDPDIDLVVCNTRVDTHVLTTAPSLNAGKAVFIEWPLAENYAAAQSLTSNKRIDASIIGLQGRVSPIALKLKDVLRSGRIGRVLSSDVRTYANLGRRDSVSESVSYFTQRSIGGNHVTIAFAHTIDYVHDVLGEFDGFQSRMQIQRPVLKIRDSNGVTTDQEIRSDVPDLVAVHGKLAKGKADIADNATLSFTFRSGHQFKGTPGFIWTINGEKGEIMVTANGAYVHSDSYKDPIDIQLHDHATDEVVPIEWDWQDWQKDLPRRSRIVAELYERFARWWESGAPAGDLPQESEWPRLHDAVARMKEFDELFKQYDAQGDGE
ncbi:oxidoreductase family protein [Xylaria bambusicola]|uniref:oxidoreductase family protein n=1 Tax=Xylaria bambusicola TaxID=326684 RepID=UPI00200898A8|nr:oxidoreductase family protein [Xylaria bambusicola]KAI0508980.1 oxidoreductase family protein [Xylaria bambusicola]